MDFSVTILGSSSAIPLFGRHQTSQLVRYNTKQFLVDCGEAAQIQLLKNKIRIHRINHIFISHLHGDHFFGLIGLISTMHLQGRTKTLFLYGQRGLEDIILTQLKHSGTVLRFRLVFQELNPLEKETLYEDEFLSIVSIPLNHGIDCCGFLFMEKDLGRKIIREKVPKDMEVTLYSDLREGKDIEYKGRLYKNEELTEPGKAPRSYAFCSDNRIEEGLYETLKGINVLYHEATFLEKEKNRAIQTKHSTAKEVGELAKKIGTKKLIIGHFSTRYKNLSPILAETKTEFEGVELAEEGKTYVIA